jgi:predicted HAD superfamily Cof-like phosphohydrolase
MFKELAEYQIERNLHTQVYDPLNEHTNIIAELFETIGCDLPKDRREAFKREWPIILGALKNAEIVLQQSMEDDEHEKVDGYADVIVFAVGALMKLGYDPELVMEECYKEISSREGEIVNGKFEKFTDKESVAKWHKADYSECKLDLEEEDEDN